jgi:hypothetical protein
MCRIEMPRLQRQYFAILRGGSIELMTLVMREAARQ